MNECPRGDSNTRACLRRAPLYPLSYGGSARRTLARRSGQRIPAGVSPVANQADGPKYPSDS